MFLYHHINVLKLRRIFNEQELTMFYTSALYKRDVKTELETFKWIMLLQRHLLVKHHQTEQHRSELVQCSCHLEFYLFISFVKSL